MKYSSIFSSALALLALNSCSPHADVEEEQADRTPLAVHFCLWQAEMAQTPARAVSAPLPRNTTFRVYAHPAGTSSTGTPAGTSIYTVTDDAGNASGALSLSRGNYDFYFISDNSTTTPPTASSGTAVISNGYDFMYTLLKGVPVQPASAGEKTVNIPVTTPFTRLCSQVTMKVKPGPTQPVPIMDLHVNYIKLKNLSTDRTYTLGGSTWNSSGNPSFTREITYNSSEFSRADTDKGYQEPWISSPKVVLPIDASKDLEFEVGLKITYGTPGSPKEGNFVYTPSIRKALLSGMTYAFEFTLKFYGVLTPADLTLAIREYNTVNINTDPVGGDEE